MQPPPEYSIPALEEMARTIRRASLQMVHGAGLGHPGGDLSGADILAALYFGVLRFDAGDPRNPDRDRFIMSNGHACMLQYGLAHEFGYDMTPEDLRAFRQPHSRTPGHPERGVAPTVEVTTGPLGQGIANGVGMAIAERILRSDYGSDLVDHRTWVIAGDGCFEEGVSHEAASLAGSLGLDHLTIFYDNNHITIDGATELAYHDNVEERFTAYGWQVIDVGEKANDLDALEAAMREAIAETHRPSLIIVRSHIAFPSPEMMDTREAHGNPFKPAVISEAKKILGVPDEAFHFDPSVRSGLLASLKGRSDERVAWEARVAAGGALAAKLLEQLDDNGAAKVTTSPEPFAAGTKAATRKAMQRAMDCFAVQTPGITAGSADLTDNTGMTLAALSVQSAENPGGRQFHYGIRELGMSASLTGQAHHGGFRPLGSTFFVFSDYARPAIRLAALSEAGAMFVYTHDSVGVGEDGPTHEPVEHLMALRAMPELHVVRPSDANETLDLVEEFLTASEPVTTAMILSRQDIAVFNEVDAKVSKSNARKGGYVVRENPDAVFTLVGTGSEVQHCLAANDELTQQGVATRVVALPCWRCFDAQPSTYRQDVLRRTIPSVSIEAGATLGWTKYVDQAIGIDSFGMSAPGGYVMDYFNINAATVVAHVHEALGDRR